jgi:hypothetical protein
VAGEYAKLHDSSRDSTAPAALVTAIVGQLNSGSDCVIVVLMMSTDILVSVMVKTPVPVQEAVCRANSAFLPVKVERPGPKKALAPEAAAIELDAGVVPGGLYDSPQSVPSSRAAPWELVTVRGGQLKPVASSGSLNSVTVSRTTRVVVVVVSSALQAWQYPSEPQDPYGAQQT